MTTQLINTFIQIIGIIIIFGAIIVEGILAKKNKFDERFYNIRAEVNSFKVSFYNYTMMALILAALLATYVSFNVSMYVVSDVIIILMASNGLSTLIGYWRYMRN